MAAKAAGEKLSKKEIFLSTWRRIARNWGLYLLLVPAVVLLFMFTYIPMYGIQIAPVRVAGILPVDVHVGGLLHLLEHSVFVEVPQVGALYIQEWCSGSPSTIRRGAGSLYSRPR